MLLQKPGAQFPAASLGISQQLVTPDLGDPWTSSGIADTSVHTHTHIHTQLNVCVDLIPKLDIIIVWIYP